MFQNAEGEWNGLVKEILDGNADMIMTSFVINQVRNEVIDLTSPFLESGITIMVSIRKGAISPYAFLGKNKTFSSQLIFTFSLKMQKDQCMYTSMKTCRVHCLITFFVIRTIFSLTARALNIVC